MKMIVTGAGGFIGGHLVKRLVADGHTVYAFDHKPLNEWYQVSSGHGAGAVSFAEYPLDEVMLPRTLGEIDYVYHLAADMGGIGFIEANKLKCSFSAMMDIRVIKWAMEMNPLRLFYASSACVYPVHRQDIPNVLPLRESMAWPANPEPGYGMQKLYTEELMHYLEQEHGIPTRIGRYHNAYGPYGTWDGGREKAPAAMCRKVAVALLTGEGHIEVWGDGEQTRSFMYVDDCVEGTIRLTESVTSSPVNIGSSELVTIDQLAELVMVVAGATHMEIKHVYGALGVRGRNSDNDYIKTVLNWEPTTTLLDGLEQTYAWVYDQVKEQLT